MSVRTDILCDNLREIGAVHTDPANMGPLAPVSVVQVAPGRQQLQAAGFTDARQQHLAVGAIEPRHINGVQFIVTPVQVSANPVHRQSIRVFQGDGM